MASTTTSLSLAQANRICDGVVAACKDRGFAPVVVVVLDENGHQVSETQCFIGEINSRKDQDET